MTVAERVAQKVSSLLPQQQLEVLDFVKTLESQRAGISGALIDPRGMWAGQGTDISPEDLVEARREMWGRLQDGKGC